MNNIGDRLREIRLNKGFTQGQLAEKLQCSDKAISCYENNKNLDKVYDFQKICEYLDADINYLITGKQYSVGREISKEEQQVLSAYNNLSDSDKRIVDFILKINEKENKKPLELDNIQNKKTIYYFPIFYQSAAAGIGHLSETNQYQMEELELQSIPKNAKFGMYIKGNSMEKSIYENDIILIDPSAIISDVLNDEIVVALFGEELVCKRLSIDSVNQVYNFNSDNPNEKGKSRINQKCSDFKLIGKVVHVIHR